MCRIPQFLLVGLLLVWAQIHPGAAEPATATPLKELFRKTPRVLCIGDSITYGGQYLVDFEVGLRLSFPEVSHFEILNLGLSSETVSGLSEDGHAGGQFPRPNLHERIDRVLSKVKPQIVLACYGMNDGIYLPIEKSRFESFRDGIILLHEKAELSGAKIFHLTPATFDPGPEAPPEAFNYNQTLDAYSQWLLAQRSQGWEVIDLHFPMNRELAERRKLDPQFRFAKDRIHPDAQGHWVMARELLRHLGLPTEDFTQLPSHTKLLHLVGQRSTILKHAWLSDTGHLRPGVPQGKPLPEAEAEAAQLETEIRNFLRLNPTP
jgi:lysophospholipase L1-like esterase